MEKKKNLDPFPSFHNSIEDSVETLTFNIVMGIRG